MRTGTAYGAFGSFSEAVTPALVVSEMEDVRGTDPVRSTIRIPSVRRVMPREREKYSSSAGKLMLVYMESIR